MADKIEKKNKVDIYESLITGLKQAIDYEKGKKVKGINVRKVTVKPVPSFTAKEIKTIRNKTNLSLSTFALVLGVSQKTVEAWESGRNEPMGPAQRMLSLISDKKFLEKYKIIMENK
jgi:putative transcriptional regulator